MAANAWADWLILDGWYLSLRYRCCTIVLTKHSAGERSEPDVSVETLLGWWGTFPRQKDKGKGRLLLQGP